ncbi:unnamed protein product [Owenia fusiformis]|uniref:Uncharacterized protein n=1 Tax=Owenia fusiformis TaxID=6347 RepID=A0A8J1XXB1_OWEFU|nr:unnamed protein product [Owenia fusiformis]
MAFWIYSLISLIFIQHSYGVRITDPSGSSLEVNSGDTFQITCEYYTEDEGVNWYLNGMILNDNPDYRILAEELDREMSESTLTKRYASSDDSGHYKCMNKVDIFDDVTIEVTVIDGEEDFDVEIFEPDEDDVTLEEGDALSLKCKGCSVCDLVWKVNGMPLNDGPGVNIEVLKQNGKTVSWLRRDDMEARFGGQYKCQDEEDPFGGDSVEVKVEAPGAVNIKQPSPFTSMPGESFTLECQSSDSIVWYKEDDQLEDGVDGYIIAESYQGSKTVSLLTKEDATEDDSGTYYCSSRSNSRENDDVTVRIGYAQGVESAPPGVGSGPVPTLYENIRLRMQEQMITLKCIDGKDRYSKYSWTKDSTSSFGDEETYKENGTELMIQNVDERAIGLYECMTEVRGKDPLFRRYNLTSASCMMAETVPNVTSTDCQSKVYYGTSCTLNCTLQQTQITNECQADGTWDGSWACDSATSVIMSTFTLLIALMAARLAN